MNTKTSKRNESFNGGHFSPKKTKIDNNCIIVYSIVC